MKSIFIPEDPRYYLQDELTRRLERRPSYSLRAFARDLQIASSTLSEFLNGKSGLSNDRAVFLAKKLALDSFHKEHFLDLINFQFAKSKVVKLQAGSRIKNRLDSHPSRVTRAEFKVISDWYHLALLEYIEIKKEQFSIKAAAHDLRISAKTAQEALSRLVELKLVSNDCGYRLNSEATFIGDDSPSAAIVLFHRQLLNKAKQALDDQSVDEREMGHVLLSMDRSLLPQFKQDLKKMYLDLAAKYAASSKNKDTIYCLGVQLHRIY